MDNSMILIKSITRDLINATTLIDNLNAIGYRNTFELVGTKLMCRESGKFYQSIELIVDEIFLMDQFDTSINDYLVYTLRARDYSVKGIFTDYPVLESIKRCAL